MAIELFSKKHTNYITLLTLIILSVFLTPSLWAADDSPTIINDPTGFSILEAQEKGSFNMGPAVGDVTSELDETAKKNVLKFDYTIFKGSIIGVWTKSFPSKLGANAVDAVKIGVRPSNPDQLRQISLKLEIKGENGAQNIPLSIGTGWTYARESVDWGRIGKLTEIVFVVSPMESDKRLDGIVYLDLDFYKLTPLQKYFTLVKSGLALAAALLLFLVSAFLGKMLGRFRKRTRKPASGFTRDFINGIVTVAVIAITIFIYSIGTISPLDSGISFNFLAAALLGVIITRVLKTGLTGKALTPAEVFQNALVTGLLAASSGRMELLQPPASWIQILALPNLIAAVTFLVYSFCNARSLSVNGKHLRAVTGTLIVLTPYLLNWLLIVENVNLLQALVNTVTAGLLAAWPVVLTGTGQFFIIFVFNEVVINSIGMVTKGRTLKTSKAHLSIFLVSLGVVVSGLIANLGSTPAVAALPEAVRAVVCILATMLSFAGLWGEVYLITGTLLDGGHRKAPSGEAISKHVNIGIRKGMAFGGIVMGLLYILDMILNAPAAHKAWANMPIIIGIVSGALIFPLIKTMIETFDGSLPFFERTMYSYRNWTLCGRGAIIGFGLAHMITQDMFQRPMSDRVIFGLVIGVLSSGGISFLRDVVYALTGKGRVMNWRLYLIDSLLGAFVGSAVAFYLDHLQVPVLVEKFKLYVSSGFQGMDYITYPLVNKWGRIDLGTYTGGVKLIFQESLAGVINWSIAAWLFAINKVFLQAYFEKDKSPIKFFFSKAGFAQLIEHMIYVLRWGLWMSPIIFTGLRMMPEPTWYNQDGAIRTLFAIYHNVTMSPAAFQAWSLQVFVYIMAFDLFRILIWMDHMGLRVATLVNLSFIGMDRLDERIARFIGRGAAQRYIPEGVKRFATWAPLLIPFYIPRGQAWDYAWSTSEAMQSAARAKGGMLSSLQSLGPGQLASVIIVSIFICAALFFAIRLLRSRSGKRHIKEYELDNREYKVVLKENGEIYSEAKHNRAGVYPDEYDISRRSYDIIDPCGRILYLVDESEAQGGRRQAWPVIGNFPKEKFETSHIERHNDILRVVNTSHGVRATIEINLPDLDSTAELWKITIENMTDKPRRLKVVPYLEWVLNGGIHDRFHTQYARLYPEMEYISSINSILSWQKSSKAMGILASDIPAEGFLTSRVDFIGRARSIWSPRIFETLNFLPAADTAPYPTFDPIGSLVLNAPVAPKASATMRLMIGYAKNKTAAVEMINKHLKPRAAAVKMIQPEKKKSPLIGHGEIPEGTPQPYFQYTDNGDKLLVRTPYTPRPFDHALSNPLHSIMVTNRGLHTSCNGNSQQNRLTPDWPDTVTKEVPTEAIYLYDPDAKEWYSPTYHPLNDTNARCESEFGIDGTAVFRMVRGPVSTKLAVFVPPEEPLGVYLLTVKNNSDQPRRMRVGPYFQMVLSFQPERSGPLQVRYDKATGALLFENPRNTFRSGWAFVSMSLESQKVESRRGRFFGTGRGVTHPFMLENGAPDFTQLTDDRQIASFLGTLEIPPREERTVAIILGQADNRKDAIRLAQKYKNVETAKKSLEDTKTWWLNLMRTLEVKTNDPEFDRYQHWLKYQAIAERIWPRRGFYQTSGAFGFRDQLQDTINLMWVDPALARKQIRLCASMQFLEGDVFHWFFTLTDGRTAFACRTHASDNPLWLAWGVVEYIRATGDDSILNEMVPYMVAQFPFAPLPKNKQGWGHLYHRSTKADSIYRHCLKSIDLVLKKRMGSHGLPLMGTGDWNDGLDEIGSEGKGESVWLGFFLYYILKDMVNIIESKEGKKRKEYYVKRMSALKDSLENTWRGDRYLRAIHDDGTEIGVKDSGIWEIDTLTAAWAVMTGINFERGAAVFNTALKILEKDNAILLGWPALREDTKPYLGRSSKYPEGVRENGMYCHGVQWLVRAARILAEQFEKNKNYPQADAYRYAAYRLWMKISPLSHVTPGEIEIYGGQPNKQSADILTKFDQGRMIWHGYTGAAGWMLRQVFEGVIGAALDKNNLVLPPDIDKPRGELRISRVHRDVTKSPLKSVL